MSFDYNEEVEDFLATERERYCHTVCKAEKMEDCIFYDIVFVKKQSLEVTTK